MSKIEIDTSEVSLEEQIRLAWNTCVLCGLDGAMSTPYEMFKDFVSGKFSKAPLPEIVKPSGISGKATICHFGDLTRIEYEETSADGWFIRGPFKPTEREAILAFNALFGDKS